VWIRRAGFHLYESMDSDRLPEEATGPPEYEVGNGKSGIYEVSSLAHSNAQFPRTFRCKGQQRARHPAMRPADPADFPAPTQPLLAPALPSCSSRRRVVSQGRSLPACGVYRPGSSILAPS